MTLDVLLEMARNIVNTEDGWELRQYGPQLAQGIIDMLGEAQPCGLEPPPIVGDKNFDGLYLDTNGLIAVEDARAYAAMIIRQAEAAEARTS